MEIVERWLRNSLLLKAFSTLSKYDISEQSVISKAVRNFSKVITKCYKGSTLNRLFSGKSWEDTAVENSRFMRIMSLLAPCYKGIIDIINTFAKQSILLRLVNYIINGIFIMPFRTLSLILFPALFVSTGFKALFSSLLPSSLMLRIAALSAALLMYFIHLPVDVIARNSFIAGNFCWFFNIDIDAEKKKYIKNGGRIEKEQYLLVVVSGLLGILHYFLPRATFIKLFAVLFLGPAVYFHPGLGMAAIAFILPFTQTTYIAAVVGLTFVSVLMNFRRLDLKITGVMIPAALFTVLATVAALFSVTRGESIKALQLYVVYFMLFYSSGTLFKDRNILKTSILSFVLSSLVVASYGIYQYFFVKTPTAVAWVDVNQFPELSTRVYSTFENPNVLAEYLVFSIPIVLALMWSAKRYVQKMVSLGILGLITLCLVLTYSRGGWLGLVFAIIVFAALKDKRFFIVIIVIALLSPMVLPSVVETRIASIGSLEESSNAFRISIWVAAVRMIKDYWLTGIGLGLSAFSRVYRHYMLAGTPALHAHNLFLQVGIEMGIVGLLLLLWACLAAYIKARRPIHFEQKHSIILAGILAALAGHLIHGLFDYVWFSPKIVMIFWMYLGMTSALSSVLEKG
jgi:O-antigen ligase